MNFKLLAEQHLEFLSLTGGYTGSSESSHVKIPHCWKSHVTAHMSAALYSQHSPGKFSAKKNNLERNGFVLEWFIYYNEKCYDL